MRGVRWSLWLLGEEITNLTAFLALISSTAEFVEGDDGVRLGVQTVHELLKQADIRQDVYDEYKDANFAPPPLLLRMVEAGMLGKKSGRGFYTY